MIRETKILRALLVMFVVGLALASGLLNITSLDFAALYPELAHLRLPIYICVVGGLVQTLVGVTVAIWAALGRSHPSIVLGWFAAALELRPDNEMTV